MSVSADEKLRFSRNLLVFGNLALLGWTLLAFFAMWTYNQVYGYVLLLFTAGSIYLILRRLGCSSCYYCVSCTSGFGRLAGAFFGRGYIKKGSVGNRKGFIGFIYLLLTPIPVAVLVLSLLEAFSVVNVLALVGILAVSVYSFATWTGKTAKPASK